MPHLEKILIVINISLYASLAVFSYAYVDLNLTLSQNQLVLNFVSTMQQLGYYHRPAATILFIIFILFAFTFFAFNLWLFRRTKISLKYLKISVCVNTLILIFAYPFLSSDLFNYIFDAKIITYYHVSPYSHRPLDFPNDDWLRFMRWVHRYSPYGPLWLGMSTIPAVLGFGKFALNFLAFKVFIALFHLANSYLIFKILKKINPKNVLFGTAFYALNPLFLIEGVINAHNDVVLATSILLSIYLLIIRKTVFSYVALVVGALVKYLSILNLPWLVIFSLFRNNDYRKLIVANVATLALFTYLFSSFRITVPFVSAGSTQVQFQPWYLFWTMPLLALIPKASFIAISIALSIAALARYLPFLYFGDWSHPQTTIFMQLAIVVVPLVVAVLIVMRGFVSGKK